jgi:copper chaperone NosL
MSGRWRRGGTAVTVVLALSLGSCSGTGGGGAVPAPREITGGTACSLDGMLLGDYPGPKAQIHYADADRPDYFCDMIELFRTYLKPERVRTVRALYVQDMGTAEWDRPRGNWTDARAAHFVVGSRRTGSMGRTIASFAQKADADRFAVEFGGRVVRFDDVKPEDAVLDGGALHDSTM